MSRSFNTIKTINGKKPKTKRAERYLLKREPKVIENVKSAMFVKGPKTSEIINKVLHNLVHSSVQLRFLATNRLLQYMLKKPEAIMLQKHNQKRPFEEESEINFLSDKNDCSLFAYGTHSKKRPHNLILGRCFDHQVLDMIELGVTRFQSIDEFSVKPIISSFRTYLSSR